MPDEQVGQAVQDILGVQPTVHDDGQASSGELVDHRQHSEGPAVMSTVHDEVVRPDVVGPAGPETDARSVVQPQTAPLRLLHWHL